MADLDTITDPDAHAGETPEVWHAVRLDDARFDAPLCRNCNAALLSPYCANCGQKKLVRLGLRDLAHETWLQWRLFEFAPLKAALGLMTAPGRVAREYVLGRRAAHINPLKLMLLAVALLLVVLARANYLQSSQFGEVNRVMAVVAAYGKWNFSLGIVAILAASMTVFWRRLGYNVVEHLVLAAYTHTVIIVLIVINLLPTLLGASPEFIAAHRVASSYYLYVVKAVVVTIAFAQFFVVDPRREWWRLLVALVVYLAVVWGLSQGFSRLALWYVLRH